MQADLCNLSKESRSQEVILYTGIGFSIAFLSVTLRIAGKAVSERLAWDDAMVVAALLLTVIPLGCVLDMVMKGFGEHIWNLEDGKLLPVLRACRSPSPFTSQVLILGSVYLMVHICYCAVYDQDLFSLVLSGDLQDTTIPHHSIHLSCISHCQQLSNFLHRHLRMPTDTRFLEP